MTRQLIVRREAEADIAEAFDWYSERRQGLGDEFLVEVDELLAKIIENPSRFSVVYRDVRRGLLRRFPYKVFFHLLDNKVVVIAVVHVRRHPSVWQRRASK